MNGMWRAAVAATLHCLTGCAIGEVLGVVIGTAAGLPSAATIVLAVALAFAFGYTLTFRAGLRSGLRPGAAVRLAFAADSISIAVMEIVDNATILAVPQAMAAGLGTVLFWATLFGSLAVAFVVTLPVNRFLIGRGLGHAIMHHHHGQPTGPAPTDHHAGHHDAGHHDASHHDAGRHDAGQHQEHEGGTARAQ